MLSRKNTAADIWNRRRARRSSSLILIVTLTALAALTVWLAFVLLRRLPERTLAMTIYPEGSLNFELAKRYREILARSGVELRLVPSAGAVESVARLRDPAAELAVPG